MPLYGPAAALSAIHFSRSSMAITNQSQNAAAVQVTHIFACGHHTTRAATPGGISGLTFSETACPAPDCQAIPTSQLLGERGVSDMFKNSTHNWASETIRNVIFDCNATLNKLGECSPLLWSEQDDAAKGDRAMANLMRFADRKWANTSQRANALDAYLDGMSVIALMGEFQALCAVRAPTRHISFVADAITKGIVRIEHARDTLLEAAQQVRSAVALGPLSEATCRTWIATFNKHYGVEELAILRSSPEGQSILSLPITTANILAARRYCVRNAQAYQEEMALRQEAEQRVLFQHSYPFNRGWKGSGTLTMLSAGRDIRSVQSTLVLSSKLKAGRKVMRVDTSRHLQLWNLDMGYTQRWD